MLTARRSTVVTPRGRTTAIVIVITLVLTAAWAVSDAHSATTDSRAQIVKRLNRGLAGTPMAGLGRILERKGRQFNISPYLIAAIAAKESSLGAYPCSNNRKNVWGLASCNNSWPVPYFETWNEAIHFQARFLKSRWPQAAAPWDYHGYAACTPCWANGVASHMRRLFGVPPNARYR